jgi:hypothetical protein
MYYVEVPLLEALVTTASALGDKGFYLSLLIDTGRQEPRHWYIPFGDLTAYRKLPSFWVENVIFSPNAIWGLIAAPEDFGILGGKPEFMQGIRDLLPNVNEQVNEFLIRRQLDKNLNIRIDWVSRVLQHVYGKEGADFYIKKYGLP